MLRAAYVLAMVLCLLTAPVMGAAQDWKALTRYDKNAVKTQLTDRFVKYAQIDTQSNPSVAYAPSSKGQKVFAKQLAKELKKYGAQHVKVSENSLVTADIAATSKNPAPAVAFLAHLDTAPEISAHAVKPRVIKHYDGKDIVLDSARQLTLNSYTAPKLTAAHGHDLIVANGGTSLGADDKAGIAVIMTLVQYLYDHPEIAHGPLKIVFTPDESTGAGMAKLNPADLGVQYAYTVSGGDTGELMTENFNAKSFVITFTGYRAVRPGLAQNSAFADNVLMASDFHTLLPRYQRPETTTDKRGFIYVNDISTQGDTTTVRGIIRAFSDEETAQLVSTVQNAFNTVKSMHARAKGATLAFRDEYKNMESALPPAMLQLTKTAMQAEEITPKEVSLRGSTDGAVLSAAGIPAPDIFAGIYNTHTALEYVDADVMESSLRTLIRLLTLWETQKAL